MMYALVTKKGRQDKTTGASGWALQGVDQEGTSVRGVQWRNLDWETLPNLIAQVELLSKRKREEMASNLKTTLWPKLLFLNDDYEEVKQKAKSSGASEAEKKIFFRCDKTSSVPGSEGVARLYGREKAVEEMMTNLKIPALVIRSLNLKKISALSDC